MPATIEKAQIAMGICSCIMLREGAGDTVRGIAISIYAYLLCIIAQATGGASSGDDALGNAWNAWRRKLSEATESGDGRSDQSEARLLRWAQHHLSRNSSGRC